MDRMKDRLDALWQEYREATPDPEASSNFMPQLWRKIEARRVETTSVFRRLAQICVMATIALALVMSVVLIPHGNNDEVFYSGTYVDALAAEHSNDYVDVLAAADLR
jgi:anti-sigma-K factor RskA